MSRMKIISSPFVVLWQQIYGHITKKMLQMAFLHRSKQIINSRVRRTMIIVRQKLRFLSEGAEYKAIYMGWGLLVLSSVLLAGVLINMNENHQGMVIKQEQLPEQQELSSASVTSGVSPVSPQVIAGELPEAAHKDQTVDAPMDFTQVSGQIKLEFGWQLHPLYNDWRYHSGIDVIGMQDQGVHAVASGRVSDIYQDRNSGLTIIIKNNNYCLYYGSLSKTSISKGTYINVGQEIGKMGICDAEPYYHLHLAIKKDDQYIDPKIMMKK